MSHSEQRLMEGFLTSRERGTVVVRILHKKHRVWLHRVGVANLPKDYVTRLTDMPAGQRKCLTLLVADAYDCILSKLERAAQKTEKTRITCSGHRDSMHKHCVNDTQMNCATI